MKSLMNVFLIMTVGVAATLVTGCTGRTGQPNIELIQDMMVTPALKAQSLDVMSGQNQGSMRVPPDNTTPVGFESYAYTDAETAGRELKNSMAGDSSQEVMMTGQKMYETNCMICHGIHGEGGENSTVGPFMALKPPTLLSDKVKGWSDGQLYHVITAGQGVMGPYASHIPQKYRWQVVNYIRHLQKQK